MKQKIVQMLYNDHSAYKQCIKMNDKIFKSKNIDYKLLTKPLITSGKRSISDDTDIDRIYYLQQNPSAWYLDADAIINKWPDFEMQSGYPYISYSGAQYDLWAIFGNNCSWFFDYLMEAYYKANQKPIRFWAHYLINMELKNKVKPVPEGYINHLHLSGAIASAEKTGRTIERAGYSIKIDYNDNWILEVK